jgi:adenine deaminase
MADPSYPLPPALDELITRMPKVELHVHLEGTLEPELAFRLAEKNGIALPYADAEQMRAAYDFADLQSFLDVYYAACAVLTTREDFRLLTLAYLHRAAADNIRHVEPFFDPQSHTARGIAFGDVIGGILDGLTEGKRELGITSRLIMCFLRDHPAEDAEATLTAAEPWIDQLAAVGLDSEEPGHPPEPFSAVYARARKMGLRSVAHAGEEGDASMVARTLDSLQVARIDHGVRAASDPAVMRRLAEEGVTLTVCPLSNVRLKVFETLAQLPLRKLLDAGVAVMLNSDDPAYFGGYLGENYRAACSACELTRGDLYRLGLYAISGSFADALRQFELLDELADVFNGGETADP